MKITTINEKYLFLTPVIFILHNIEETLTMASWSRSVPAAVHPPVFTEQFGAAVAILSILGIGATLFSRLFRGGKFFLPVMTAFLAMLFMNAFFPHILATIGFKRCAPGVMTALLINLPFSGFFLYKIYGNRLISQRAFIIAVITGPLLGALLAALSLMAGKYIAAGFLV